jgi:hypothetical protein
MAQEKQENPKATFQAAVKSIHCDWIKDVVTLMVTSDWTAKCAWYARYKDPSSESARKGKVDKTKVQACQGPLCNYVVGYRDELLEEERKKAK